MNRANLLIHWVKNSLTVKVIWSIAGAAFISILGCGGPPLETWHTKKLKAEFTVKKISEVQTFEDYLKLEERLFAQLQKEIYNHTGTGPGYEFVRYSSGSLADPTERTPNWNRSFELPDDTPVGGVLLLHGMSDSPYSLRALGLSLNRHHYWVVGPRLPGHGTAPSGLKYVHWEDMAAVVRLCIRHLSSKVGNRPIHIMGYSTGAPLALDFTLDALENEIAPLPTTLVFISPAIGIHPLAGLAAAKDALSKIPGLERLAWVAIEPEFDPYKYNSFSANAGAQVHAVTSKVATRLKKMSGSDALEKFPPTLVFQSTVDATVSTHATVDNLLKHLTPKGHELVLFDINRHAAAGAILVSDPGPLTDRFIADDSLPFALTLVTNETTDVLQVAVHRKKPFSKDMSETQTAGYAWPTGVISLSHLALPFPPDDPLYGQRPPPKTRGIYLGQMAIKGERGLLKISSDWLLRLRNNPFFDYLENRVLQWIDSNGLQD